MSTSTESFDTEGGSGLIAEYVLGLLSSAEHARVDAMIEADPALQAERDFWVAQFSPLNAEFDEVTPPAYLSERIERRAFGDRPAANAVQSLWHSLALWRGLTAGALAIAVAAIGFSVLQPKPDVKTLATQLVAALDAEGSDVKFVALYDGAGAVRLTALSGQAVPDRDFELWAIQGAGVPVSMGVIPASGQSLVAISPEILAGWGEGSVLAITLEEAGGSPDGTPYGPVIAQGAITKI
jgi:anti-sigma-K factor RskA